MHWRALCTGPAQISYTGLNLWPALLEPGYGPAARGNSRALR
jgi:hypothetical protein